jgi:FkbM family methyltransferase
MLCDLRDHVERQVYFMGLYEPIEVFVLLRLLRPGMTMIDGGANVGQFTILAADAVSPGGAVHSFEPVPTTFGKLQRNVEINAFSNVHTNNAALWREPTTLRLGLAADKADNAGAFGIDMVDAVAEVETRATSLDGYAEAHEIPHVDFIKLDVEGAELQALHGMDHVLERDHPTLLVEICRKTAARLGYDVQEIWDLLVDGMGYRGWAVGLWTESEGALTGLRDVTQQNVLFYHEQSPGPPEMPSDLKTILRWARRAA